MVGTGSASGTYDAIIVGGGHNGLVTAAYLARAGLKPLVLEARPDLGGAARTETPWGPEFKVTALSYVMSLMPAQILQDLQLAQHGYHVIPMGPSYIPFPDGRSMLLTGDHANDHAELSKFSSKDADAYPRYEAWLKGIADVLSPLLMKTPPKVGSKRPGDLVEQLKLAWGMRGLDVRKVGDTTRLFTMSIADLLDDWFESPEVKGMMSINGVIGTWAGPCEPGTAYVMLHHSIGDVGDGTMDGSMGSWGYPIGGMGAVSAAIASSARSFGAEIRTNAPVARILVRDGRAVGVALEDGTEIASDLVVAATHPQITFLRQLDRRDLPDDFVEDIERWKSRSGTVKINLAIEGLPTFAADPDMPLENFTGVLELCDSLEYVEKAFQDARSGRAAARALQRHGDPVHRRQQLVPRRHAHRVDVHAVGAAHVERRVRTPRSSRRTPTGSSTSTTSVAPGVQEAGAPPAGDRALRDGARVPPDRRQHLPRRAHPRAAVPHAPGARLQRLHDPDQRALPVLVRHPRRRRRDGIAGFLCSSRMLSDKKRRRFRRSAGKADS